MALVMVLGCDSEAGTEVGKRVAPVTGALSASTVTPIVGESLYLYLNATPLRDLASLKLEIRLPDGLALAEGSARVKVFNEVGAGRTVTLTAAVTNAHSNEQRVLGSATVVDTETLRLSRSFVLDLNPEPKKEAPFQRGKSKDGKPLAIYGDKAESSTQKSTGQSKEKVKMPQRVMIETSKGNILVELKAEEVPVTVENFLRYVNEGLYDGTIFHRVIPNFMAQGGGFTADMKQKKTHAPIVNESAGGPANNRGTLAMARTNVPDSATCQFFINVKDNAFLNSQSGRPGYAVFAEVVEGMDVVDAIVSVKTGSAGGMQDVPVEAVTIVSARVVEQEH